MIRTPSIFSQVTPNKGVFNETSIRFRGDNFRSEDQISIFGETKGLLCDAAVEDEIDFVSSSQLECKIDQYIANEIIYLKVNGAKVKCSNTD